MALLKALSRALILIIRIRFLPGTSLATHSLFLTHHCTFNLTGLLQYHMKN